MNVIELVVYAIIALALIFLAITLFNPIKQETLIDEIKEGINAGQTNIFLGKTFPIGTRILEKEFHFDKRAIEDASYSLAIECNNPKICCIRKEEQSKEDICTKPINWDYSFIEAKQETTLKTSVRCINELNTLICRIYFGLSPAQAEIIEIKNQQDQNSNTIISNIKVKNSGETQLALGIMELNLQKKVLNKWENTEDQFKPQEIQYLLPQQEHTFVWAIQTTTVGEYRLNYKFSGNNAGFDQKTEDYNITKANFCSIIEEETYEIQTIQEGVKYNEIKKCENCNYAYECASAWQNKYPMVNYQIVTKEKTYCEKQTELFTCEQEAS